MDYKSLLKFLRQLAKNNNKEWFDDKRETYEPLRKEWVGEVESLIEEIAGIDDTLGVISARDCIFRINRDVRFSADKSPYKTHFGASISRGGKNSNYVGYYLHLEPGASFFGAGAWMPAPDRLAKYRQEIAYHFPEWRKIVEKPSFRKTFGTLEGEKLSRPPRGYEADHPALEYLKYKSLIVSHPYADEELSLPGFRKSVLQDCREAMPLVHFLNRALD